MKHILKDACKRYGNKDKAAICKLYNKNGVEMSKDDAMYFKNGDVFYLAMEGEKLFIYLILVSETRYIVVYDSAVLIICFSV